MVDDAFKFLKRVQEGKYDLIVLDPPAFAKHRGAINNALQGYKKLNLSAIEKLAPGGFFHLLLLAGDYKGSIQTRRLQRCRHLGRRVRILHQLTQPADHPVNIYHPEGEYLKGLVLWVE